ncbi:MAG: asparagine synthase (glutamine-hydrolyzing) [Desulfobacteraceae bacterium]|nr:asparagine synthase (glutamine-hydrolyzing) [Desulfobacteraceae bacterium]MBC2748990.1 asparagine synthase (glutamine-hydrolyzing) [Desulfobacteraceae bacterium]
MCGIAGVLSPDASEQCDLAISMAQSLSHRGPDANGVWSDAAAGIALSHSRLSIIDLSQHGGQPMISHEGRYVLSYNGEIYNHIELRRALEDEGVTGWRGHSDTEVLLAAIERWGLQETLKISNGMFAFALWDRKQRKLTLARDRMGEKPLYVGWLGKKILFASELKALHRLPEGRPSIDRHALGYFLRFGYIPAPLSIYAGIYKLPQAHYVILDSGNCDSAYTVKAFQSRCVCYWNLPAIVNTAVAQPNDMDESAALDQLDALLTESVRLRMVADVPVGSMLSGGIDSSLVTAIMQRLSSKPIKTFTIGFNEEKFDEAKYAKPVAAHIGSNHTEITLSHTDALEVIPRLAEIYDEPFADPSQIPTILVSAVARESVTVALSGDGGDELFSGYGRYWAGLRIWPTIKWLPPMLRLKTGQLLAHIAKSVGDSKYRVSSRQLAHRIWRFGRRVAVEDFDSFYANLQSLSLSQTASSFWPSGLPLYPSTIGSMATMEIEQRMMLVDQCSYLPHDVLVKTDRASMAVSLELRVPLIDPNLIEFAWRLPACLRRKGNQGKLLLRRLLYRYVPQNLVERPKKGFEIPQDEWLRGPLREWMLDLLSPSSISPAGYLDNNVVQRLVKEHLAGQGDHGYALWPALMFQAWLANW